MLTEVFTIKPTHAREDIKHETLSRIDIDGVFAMQGHGLLKPMVILVWFTSFFVKEYLVKALYQS